MSDTLEVFGTEYTNVAGFKATDDNDNIKTYIRPQGAKSITANGNNIDVAAYATANVNVSGADTVFVVTLSYDDQDDLFVPDCTWAEMYAAYSDGKTIVVEAEYPWILVGGYFGEYYDTETRYGLFYDVLTSDEEEVDTDVYVVFMTEIGYLLAQDNVPQELYRVTTYDTTSATAEPSDVATGKSFFGANGYEVGTNQGGGTYQTKSVTPTESAQAVTADNGYDALAQVNVGAISSSYVGSNVPRRDSNDLSASGATVSVPAGYYASAASKSVASGTAGTPTATKGAVSNHAVTVTPSVTNVAGYISGGTINGTGVSVAASELVSGTYTVDSSGTKDVTSYASASVPAGTAGTPTATKGTVQQHSIEVTPSVTNTSGFINGGTKTGTPVTVTASELVSGSTTLSSNNTYDVTNYASVVVNVSGSGGVGTLLATKSLGTISTSSTQASDTGQTVSVTGINSYDLLIVETSVNSVTNNRHTATVGMILLTASSSVSTKNGATVCSNKWNSKISSTGVTTTRQGTTSYGIYPNSCTISSGNATIAMYQRYNSTNTGTINNTYTARVYGVKLYDLIGG